MQRTNLQLKMQSGTERKHDKSVDVPGNAAIKVKVHIKFIE